MIAYMLQSALLLLFAYFAGCFLGCLVRRTFFAHTLAPVVARQLQPVPVAAPVAAQIPQPATPVTRFERALTGTATSAAAQAAPAPAAAPPPIAPVPAPAVPQGVVAASAAAAAAMSAVAAAAAAARPAQPAPSLPAAMGTSGPASVTAPIGPAPVPAPVAPPVVAPQSVPAAVPAAAAHDLTRIRAIDDALQRSLNDLGVRSYADIAAWKPEDVARIGGALKKPGRIEQENWIEQAQILAKGGETYYSRRKLNGELPSARPTPDEGERITVRVPAATRPEDAKPAASAAPDLKAAAAAAAAAVQAAQAAVATAASGAAAQAATAVAATAVVAVPAEPAPGGDRPIGTARDALQRIAGINGEVERLLNVQGVMRYSQIAGWSASEVARFDRLLGFEGRIARENWIEQAQILSRGGETAYSREMARRATEAARPARLADAIQSRTGVEKPSVSPTAAAAHTSERSSKEDLSQLRSVRSEAYRSAATPAPSGRPADDLKRIRGVGVLIEKKLNALGVTRYDQVANWTAGDIERCSEKLDFKGRIERENWVEQARILTAGGQTEFSQRVDRGEVETSKPRV